MTERRQPNPLQSHHDRLRMLNFSNDILVDEIRQVRESQTAHPQAKDAIGNALATGKASGKHRADVLWVSALVKRGISQDLIDQVWDIRNQTDVDIEDDSKEK